MVSSFTNLLIDSIAVWTRLVSVGGVTGLGLRVRDILKLNCLSAEWSAKNGYKQNYTTKLLE